MPSQNTICAYEGCDRTDILAKGLCKTHYHRVRDQSQRPESPARVLAKDQSCAYEGCEKLVGNGGAKGYCSTHARAYYYGRLGRERKHVESPTTECPVCHQVRKLDRNHPTLRIRVCQTCYRGRVAPEERQKPGPKPKVSYQERPACPSGHTYVEGSFKTDALGRRYCLLCLESKRKTHCPKGHPYSEDNVFMVNGSPQCKICRNERQRLRRNSGIGQGGVNKAKTHCPHGHEYTPENTKYTPDGRRVCSLCRQANAAKQNLRRLNLTVEQFEQMMQSQDNACLICHRSFLEVTPHIDHDHGCCDGPFSCGKCVRALLCADCNHLLGNAHDDPARLRAAMDYIERYARGKLHQ